jgi:hypothetical protein
MMFFSLSVLVKHSFVCSLSYYSHASHPGTQNLSEVIKYRTACELGHLILRIAYFEKFIHHIWDQNLGTNILNRIMTPLFWKWKYSRTPLIRMMVIRIANFRCRLGPSGKYLFTVIVLHIIAKIFPRPNCQIHVRNYVLMFCLYVNKYVA